MYLKNFLYLIQILNIDFDKSMLFGDDSSTFSREAFLVPSTPVNSLAIGNIDQDYYGEEAFDSEFDSDDEFVRKKKRKNKLKVIINLPSFP